MRWLLLFEYYYVTGGGGEESWPALFQIDVTRTTALLADTRRSCRQQQQGDKRRFGLFDDEILKVLANSRGPRTAGAELNTADFRSADENLPADRGPHFSDKLPRTCTAGLADPAVLNKYRGPKSNSRGPRPGVKSNSRGPRTSVWWLIPADPNLISADLPRTKNSVV